MVFVAEQGVGFNMSSRVLVRRCKLKEAKVGLIDLVDPAI